MFKKSVFVLLVSILCLGGFSSTSWAKDDRPIIDQSQFPGGGRINDDWVTGCKWDSKENRCYCTTSKGTEMPAPVGQCPDAPKSPTGRSGPAM